MMSRYIDAIDQSDDSVVASFEEADATVRQWDVPTIFPSLPAGDYRFVLRSAETDNQYSVVLPAAWGGTETVFTQGGKFFRAHTFIGSGEFVVTSPGAAQALLVAGGGPGGAADFGGMGGGSAGDVILQPVTLSVGTHTITVGTGGVSTSATAATKGGNTVAFDLTALGGGIGGTRMINPNDGGGGAYNNGIGVAHPTSFKGGDGLLGSATDERAGGGGRGSSGNGTDATTTQAGNGGPGTVSDIDGTSRTYGRGGAGGRRGTTGTGTPNGVNGQAAGLPGVNPGDGGSGASSTGNTITIGGPGADGIVIVVYEIREDDYLEAA